MGGPEANESETCYSKPSGCQQRVFFKSTFVFVCGALTPGTEEPSSGDPVTGGLRGHLCGDKAQPLGVSAALWLHLGGGGQASRMISPQALQNRSRSYLE